MRIRRRTKQCLNCQTTMGEIYNFCPNCGQENDDKNVSMGMLLQDFLSNYMAFDSKLFKSLPAFLLKPGHLTNEYNAGKRVTYFHPVRLYFILSLFYFFVISFMFGRDKLIDGDDVKKVEEQVIVPVIDSLNAQIEKVELDSILTAAEEELKIETGQDISLSDFVGDTSASNQISWDGGWTKFEKFSANSKVSDAVFLDSLGVSKENQTSTLRYGASKLRKMIGNQELFISYLFKNLPLMMLLLLPVFALILKLLYVRSSNLYIKHLIHTLHLHCFAYIVYGLTLLIMHYLLDSFWVGFISFTIVSTYAFISFLVVYKQGVFKTLMKFNLAGFTYIFFLFVGTIFEFFVSLLLF